MEKYFFGGGEIAFQNEKAYELVFSKADCGTILVKKEKAMEKPFLYLTTGKYLSKMKKLWTLRMESLKIYKALMGRYLIK